MDKTFQKESPKKEIFRSKVHPTCSVHTSFQDWKQELGEIVGAQNSFGALLLYFYFPSAPACKKEIPKNGLGKCPKAEKIGSPWL